MADKTDFYTKIKRSMFQYINDVGAKPFLLFQYYLTYSTAPKTNPSLEAIAADMGLVDKQGKPSKTAVCNLNKILIEAGWISIENGIVEILQPFRKSERRAKKTGACYTENLNENSEVMNDDRSENLNNHSENLNESFRKSEFLYKEEKEHKNNQKEQLKTLSADADVFAETTGANLRPEEARATDQPTADREPNERESGDRKPGKPKSEDPPELKAFRKRLTDYQKLYAAPTTKGAAIADQKAVRALYELSAGDGEICHQAHLAQQREAWRNGRVNWATVLKEFTIFQRNSSKFNLQTTGEKRHGQFKSSYEKRSEAAVEQFNYLEALRAKVAARQSAAV